MSHLYWSKNMLSTITRFNQHPTNLKSFIRNLMSRQLIYSEFGDPTKVVKLRECEVPPLGSQEILVRMLAAPINPADINTIQGRGCCLPYLPHTPGDEGVGEVVEIGSHVSAVKPGCRIVLTSRLLGTWRYYGAYHERDVHIISPNVPLPEASMLTLAPCEAFRMIKDFRKIYPGDTIIQNGANSPCGQCVIQLCKAWDINTLNIVANCNGYQAMKQHLLNLGATAVYTLEEAEELSSFDTSVSRPVLALNCLGNRYEDVLLNLLQRFGSVVYYGWAYDLPLLKQNRRCDVAFNKFRLCDWSSIATNIQKNTMLNQILQLMVTGKLKAPLYEPVQLNDYIRGLQNTCPCEAFSKINYVFDFTVP